MNGEKVKAALEALVREVEQHEQHFESCAEPDHFCGWNFEPELSNARAALAALADAGDGEGWRDAKDNPLPPVGEFEVQTITTDKIRMDFPRRVPYTQLAQTVTTHRWRPLPSPPSQAQEGGEGA